MAKFEIEFALEGLKLRVKGERDDVSQLMERINEQVSSIIPSSDITGTTPRTLNDGFREMKDVTPKASKRKRRTTKINQRSGDSEPSVALEWKHDPEKWGSPQQSWTTAEKALWIMFVIRSEMKTDELSSRQIADTFNKHFKQAGTIRPQNVARDLGIRKQKSPAEVGQNTSKEDQPWFLTDTGMKTAQSIINLVVGDPVKNGTN